MYAFFTGWVATAVWRSQIVASTLCWNSTVGTPSPSGTLRLGKRKSQTITSYEPSRTARSIAAAIGAERYFAMA